MDSGHAVMHFYSCAHFIQKRGLKIVVSIDEAYHSVKFFSTLSMFLIRTFKTHLRRLLNINNNHENGLIFIVKWFGWFNYLIINNSHNSRLSSIDFEWNWSNGECNFQPTHQQIVIACFALCFRFVVCTHIIHKYAFNLTKRPKHF